MAKVSQLIQAFLMIKADRVDMIVVTIHGFTYLAMEHDFDINDYEQVWQVNKVGNYLAFNINTPYKVIQTYQKAFDEIAPQRLSIKEYYKLPKDEY